MATARRTSTGHGLDTCALLCGGGPVARISAPPLTPPRLAALLQFDEERKQYYYHNAITGTTTDTLPADYDAAVRFGSRPRLRTTAAEFKEALTEEEISLLAYCEPAALLCPRASAAASSRA